ncbi:MAG: hypothetical protein H0X29_00410 [Parachlamydiaceae bacterium]|nr:hypothetical protein [Parachlamydiaceae bacterium]
MKDLKILNKINTYMHEEKGFELVQKGKKITIQVQSLSKQVLEAMFDDGASNDAVIGKFIVSKLFQLGNSRKLRKVALRTARQFQEMQMIKYNSWTRSPELTEISKKITHYEMIVKISKKLKLPLKILVENQSLVNFIVNNHLQNRIDNTYVERGFGPRVIDGQILFPLNTGSSFNPSDVSWVPHSKIPTDKKGKVQYTYGPFGFEPYHSDAAVDLRPIKLQKRTADLPPSIRLELVTSKPTYNLSKLTQGALGHGWIRVYQPEVNEQGEDTGKDFVYSVGYFIRGCLKTPDLTEFVPGLKLITTQKEISSEKWSELKSFIEDIQRNLKGEKTENEEALKVTERIKGGTCCNFSTEIFQRGTGKKMDGRLWLSRQLKFLTQPVGSVLKHVLPKLITQNFSRLQNGAFPGTLIAVQRALL